VNTLETVCAFAGFLVCAGELAVARKWVRFSITLGTPPAPKNAARKTSAAETPEAEPVPLKEVA
jgi:hypothetical protein